MISTQHKLIGTLEEIERTIPQAEIQDNYEPSGEEDFMNFKMREYFSQKVKSVIEDLECRLNDYLNNKLKESFHASDYMDKVSMNAEQDFKVSRYNSQLEMLRKARIALYRLETSTYGYCMITGLPINVKRLLVNPLAETGVI